MAVRYTVRVFFLFLLLLHNRHDSLCFSVQSGFPDKGMILHVCSRSSCLMTVNVGEGLKLSAVSFTIPEPSRVDYLMSTTIADEHNVFSVHWLIYFVCGILYFIYQQFFRCKVCHKVQVQSLRPQVGGGLNRRKLYLTMTLKSL